MSSHELVSEKPVKFIREIKIKDMKDYLLRLRKKDQIDITFYKYRDKKYPNDDRDIIKMAVAGMKKYGLDNTLQSIRKFRPDLEAEFKKQPEVIEKEKRRIKT